MLNTHNIMLLYISSNKKIFYFIYLTKELHFLEHLPQAIAGNKRLHSWHIHLASFFFGSSVN